MRCSGVCSGSLGIRHPDRQPIGIARTELDHSTHSTEAV